MPVQPLCNARTPQPLSLEAYKTSKGIRPALPELLCSTLSGTQRQFKRIPPLGGIFLICCFLFSFWAAGLPFLPESSQQLLLLAISWRTAFFCPLWTVGKKGRKSGQVPPLRLYAGRNTRNTSFWREFVVVAGPATHFRFKTVNGQKLISNQKQPRSPFISQRCWLLERGNEAFCGKDVFCDGAFCLVLREFQTERKSNSTRPVNRRNSTR